MTVTIKEIIVVEGRDDTAAIRRAFPAETIETHGYGISRKTWLMLEKAETKNGLIIFTDPDHAGEQIRKRLADRFPNAKHAYLDRFQAMDGFDVGIENAEPEDIIVALKKAKGTVENKDGKNVFKMDDLWERGLAGQTSSAQLRRKIGKNLGIGYGNATAFLRKLNNYKINKEDLNEAILAEHNQRNQE